jgi:hypothetical protein
VKKFTTSSHSIGSLDGRKLERGTRQNWKTRDEFGERENERERKRERENERERERENEREKREREKRERVDESHVEHGNQS